MLSVPPNHAVAPEEENEGPDAVPSARDITRLLHDLTAGRQEAEEELMPLVYDELRALARHYLRSERPGHTLQTMALVHEAYLRLGGTEGPEWEGKAHFLRVAASAMRRVLIDHARGKRSDKRGGRWKAHSLDRRGRAAGDRSRQILREFPETFRTLGRSVAEMVTTMPDEARRLAEQARNGDQRAFATLFESLREPLLAVIRGRLGPAAQRGVDPEDVLQGTPLNGIVGTTELLLETELDKGQVEYADAMRSCGVGA